MMLKNIKYSGYMLEEEMTVKEFIDNIIQKDKNNNNKYYKISLKKKLDCKNMVLFFEDNTLKSHHTCFYKLNYMDYLDYKIDSNYGMDEITEDNICSMDIDYLSEDSNMPSPEVITRKNNKKFSLEEFFAELEEEDKKRDLSKFLELKTEENQPSEEGYECRLDKIDEEIELLLQRKKWIRYRIRQLRQL